MLPAYAELHCRSNFTFLTGASHPEELVMRAAELGYAALAITDECSVAGVVRAHAEAKAQKIHLIVGAEMRLTVASSGAPHARLVLLAQSRRGYGHLAHWITVARRRVAKGSYLAHPADVEGKVPNAPMLAGLPDCAVLLVPHAGLPFEEAFAQAMWAKTWFQARAFLALELLHRAGDDELVELVQRLSDLTGLPIVAAGDVLMHVRSRKPLQDTLTATRLATPVADCGLGLEPNAEAHLRSRQRLGTIYEDPAWLARTLEVAASCTFSLDELRYEYPQEIVPPGETPTSYLRKLTYAGVPKRFPDGLSEEYRAQIESELALVEELKYEAYFLTVADIVAWARSREILCQGRGSAANSLVCYCLHVTEVDPRRATLLFGRFISAERNEPPDIDIDFEHQRREEVIQYIYGKYGRHRAALTAVTITYRPRSALRDVGRALGIDLQRIDAVAKSQQWFDGRRVQPERLAENGFDPDSFVCRQWMELTQQLIGFPRHLSQHPGGFVIAKERMAELVPVENASMPDRSVIQWNKDDLDELGLLKVDILALGMLSAIRRSLAFIGAKLGREALVQHISDGDTATYDMICAADTVGVFQIESRAQMSMLARLRPRCYYDLVVEVAIVRPGPIQGGMVHPYLKNRTRRDDEIDCPEELRPALMRTKGVPIFQEQVMQIAMLAADFTAGEADALRRAMAAWKRKGGLGPFHQRLVGRMVEKGYDRAYAERIFQQIEGFGEYGFPESHAAGFALLAYVSSWIKRHHPDAFLAALLNSQPMGFYAPAQLVRDARAHGVTVLPVDVCESAAETVLVPEGAHDPLVATKLAGCGVPAIDACPLPGAAPAGDPGPLGPGGVPRSVRLGLDRVSGLALETAQRIVAARAQARFESVEDLAQRARLNALELEALAQADALRPLTGHRHQAAWSVAGIDTHATPMLRETRVHETAAELSPPTGAEEMRADYRRLGLSLTRHPLALLRDTLAQYKVETASVLRNYPNGRLARASGLVTHRQQPGTAKGTVFVTLEDETGAVNVIVWPSVAQSQRKPLLGASLLTVYGQWQREGEGEHAVMHLVARRMVDHTALLDGLVSRSRDFR
jgi:error-prone DNA polymerase